MKCARRKFALLRSRNRPRTFCSRCQGTLTAPHAWPCVRNSELARSVFPNGPQRQVGREAPLLKRAKTRAKRAEKSSDSDLRGVALHFTWPQTPPAIGGGSSSRNATRSGPLRLARSGALRLLYAPASAARVRDAGAFSARAARAII